MEELEWMKNHYYPTQAEINSLATLDIDSLNGTDDPKLQMNRPGFRRHLAAINYGLGGGGYEHEALHG
jgi:hypothetical protein